MSTVYTDISIDFKKVSDEFHKLTMYPADLWTWKHLEHYFKNLSISAANIPSAPTPNLQDVTDVGNTTTNTIDTAGTKSDYFLLDTTATPTPQQGMLFWDEDRSTVGLQLNGVEARLGQDNFWYVKNQTGSPIPKGTAVMAVGALGASSRILVAPMIADGSVEAKYFLGITAEEILNGEDGFVTNIGKIRGIDTSVYGTQAGQILYCDPANPGGFTITQPTAPNLDIAAAFTVDYKSNGTLAVRALPGYELNELHDVYINTPSTGQLLRYNTNRWENWTPNFLTTVPTLDQVTTAGNTTTNGVTIGDLTVNNTNQIQFIAQGGLTESVAFSSSSTFNRIAIYNNGSTSNGSLITFGRSSFSTDGQIGSLGGLVGGVNNYGIGMLTNTSNPIAFYHGITSRLRIAPNTGNVLINTTTDAGYKLDVNGTVRVSGNLTVDTNTLFVDAGNNYVGIGTASPVSKLHIQGGPITLSADGTFNVGITNGVGAQLWLTTRDGSPNQAKRYVITGNTGNQIFHYWYSGGAGAESEIMTLKGENGNLLIGTTTDSGYKLDVNGTGRFSGNLIASERVGIGTTTPSHFLHIYRNLSMGPITTHNVANAGFRVEDSGASMYFDGNSISLNNDSYITTSGSNFLDFGTNSTTRIRVSGSGNVLIGTTTDGPYKLDINGNLRTSADAHFAIGSGRVGIGTASPLELLHVAGAALNSYVAGVIENTVSGAADFDYKNPTQVWKMGVNVSNLFRIRDHSLGNNVVTIAAGAPANSLVILATSGNVGIGTTSPITKLHIEGESGATRTSLLALVKSGGYGSTALIQNYSSVQYSGGKSFEIDVEGYNLLQLHTNNPGSAGRVILPNGNVLVGLTSDNAIDKLQVKGSGLFNLVGGSTRQLALSIIRDSGFGSTQFFQNYSSAQFTSGKSLEVDVFGLNLLQLHTDYTGATGRVIFPTGNILVNKTTDSGVDKLQVNGSVGATAINSTGNITTNTDFIVNTTGATLGLSITANNPRILMVDTVGGSDPVTITDNSGSLNITSNWLINLRKQGATHPTISALRNQNVLLSTSTDNGLGKLQVEGNITAFTYYSNGLAGWTGVIPVPGNPPGLQNIEVTGGIITNVF